MNCSDSSSTSKTDLTAIKTISQMSNTQYFMITCIGIILILSSRNLHQPPKHSMGHRWVGNRVPNHQSTEGLVVLKVIIISINTLYQLASIRRCTSNTMSKVLGSSGLVLLPPRESRSINTLTAIKIPLSQQAVG